MNWVTTNIRFPEDQYLMLKLEAAQNRKSFSALLRERAQTGRTFVKRQVDAVAFMRKVRKIAKENAIHLKGVNLTKALIDMRYEQ